jgi:hypothetical protein
MTFETEGLEMMPIGFVTKQGNEIKSFSTGAIRSTDADGERWDLITPIGLRRVAATYAEGAARYGERGWEKGMPASDLINHALRHVYLYLAGDSSEDHLAHAVWNLLAVMHFEERQPELIDIPSRHGDGTKPT